MATHRRNHPRTALSEKVRELRLGRHWTQAELAGRLGLSQSRLSEIERGDGSFTAEQFLSILKIFNVPVTHFAPERRPRSELQNALARLGAVHLQENPDVLPSDLEVRQVVRRILIAPESTRHITALAPVLVRNIDRINLRRLYGELVEVHLERRLGWLVESTLEAIREELSKKLPRAWATVYRRAEVVLGPFFDLDLRGRLRDPNTGSPDILDNDIRSAKTLDEVRSSSSAISKRWGIATSLKPEDFLEALRGVVPAINDFLRDLDRRWTLRRTEKIRLPVIGSVALILQTDYDRGTKDSDVLETTAITDVKGALLAHAGKDSELHTRHKIYLEIVPGGLPFLPQRPFYRPHVDPAGPLKNFEIEVLDIVDVVISKLMRFSANDRDDIRAMADMDRINHYRLVDRFRSAVDAFSMDSRADELPRCLINLNQVERDFLLVEESKIDLPDS